MQSDIRISTAQIIVRILAIILLVEFVVMLLLGSVNFVDNQWAVAAIDVLLLGALATPAMYFWVILPFVNSRDNELNTVNQMAMTDALTELANRRRFDHVLDIEFNRHQRNGLELALIMLDIDKFKNFNDHYGHLKGDECLQMVSTTLAAIASRPADFVARYGGEEFVCILPETGVEGALMIADKIRREIEALEIPHAASHVSDFVTVSLGVATNNSERVDSAFALINRADEFLYLAKEKGRNRIGFDINTRDRNIDTHFVKLVWKDAYRSGNNLIDTQHQQLFTMTDMVLDALLAGKGDKQIQHSITNLMDAINRHFQDEMHILEDLNYRYLDEHAAEHERLLHKAKHLVNGYQAGAVTIGEVFQFLAYDVIANHILSEDRQYFEVTRKKHLLKETPELVH